MSYQAYLDALKGHFHKLTKLEFLQPDDSVAFTLDNNSNRVIKTSHDSRAFIQDGNLDVNLQNGERRKATVTLANIDNAFDYNVNNIWFGQRIRLSMGLRLKDGTDFYLPQGVFYIQSPQYLLNHNTNKVTFNLVDKWSYLDGTLFGNLEATYQIKAYEDVSSNNTVKSIPAEYVLLDYIRTTGGYIKTDISTNTNISVDINFTLLDNLSSAATRAYSFFIYNSDYYFYSNITRTYGTGAKVYYRQQHFEGSGASIEKPSNTNVSGQVISITDTKSGNSIKSRYTINGTTDTLTLNNAFNRQTGNNKLYIGYVNRYTPSTDETVSITPMELYGFTVNDLKNNKVLGEFVPVAHKLKKGGVLTYDKIGMYDIINKKFYGSATQTDFTASPNKIDHTLSYTNIFSAIQSLLNMSKYDYSSNADGINKIDITPPSFTTYYNDKNYINKDGISYPVTNVPYDISSDTTIADLILELNDSLVGLIGYDQSGSLRIEPAQAYIRDSDKPVLWYFDLSNPNLCEITETFENEDVKNDIKIIGEGLDEIEIYGRAMNKDPRSDTNINIIGDKVLKEESSTFWNVQQCIDQACYQLKKQTALKKSISIQTTQMFHLYENGVIAIKRTDKKGSPTEKHIIQSLSIPLSQKGTMTINAVSVNDVDIEMTITSS